MACLEQFLRWAAGKYQNHRVSFDDLMQEGRIAAWQAESTFDPSRGRSKDSFCKFAAMRAMQNYLVSPPSNRVERYINMGELDMEGPMFSGRDFAPALIDALSPDPPQLTATETDILKLLCLGMTQVEVAQQLGIHKHNIWAQMGRIYKKLGVNNILQAYNIAMSRGIVQPPPLER